MQSNGRLHQHGALAQLAWSLASEPGDVRPDNEDYAGVYIPPTPVTEWERGPLFVVADGMGGHQAGEVASRLAVETLLEAWANDAPSSPAASLRSIVRDANTAVHDAGIETGRRGMGTTLTALTLAGREAIVAHIGDSRCYLVHHEQCTQLTSDHSRVAEMVRMRMISPEQAVNHPARSMLTRSLGSELLVNVDLTKQSIEQGDALVLCSDGVWDMISRSDIAELVHTTVQATDAAERLIAAAIKRGAADNVTAIVVRLMTDEPIPAAASRRAFFRRGRG